MNRFVYYGYLPSYTFPPPPYNRNEVVMYMTTVEPKFTENLIQHKGQMIVITTTIGKLIGILDNVFIDHVALVVNGKFHHIRLCEIVYFEKAEEK